MRVLITGASGLIGRELVGVLAERGHAVVALLHRARTLRRNDGTAIEATAWTGTGIDAGDVRTVTGDVSRPNLGVPEALASSLDLVIHSAAVTGFNLEEAVYEEINVGGMRHVLGFAASGPARLPVLAVSTAYVCGERSGRLAEVPADLAVSFANGYERSKAKAESLALEAMATGHLVAIARPSIVVGRHPDGVVGEFGNLYQLIRLVTEGSIRVLPAASDATLDLVPIDHVVDGLADLAERMTAAAGRIFHIVSGRPVPVSALRTLADHFPMLNPPRFVSVDRFDAALLAPLQRRLNLSVTDMFASYLRRNPRFDDAGFRALTGRCCPPTDEAFLRRLIEHALRAGFITPPGEAKVRRRSAGR